jgi:sensor c-di-GMP phosphodiesterase-like protein
MPRQYLWVIITAVILSLLGTLLPVMVAYYLSWSRATQLEEIRLAEVTSRLITRVRQTYSTTEKTLFDLNKLSSVSSCSKQHILLMQKATLNNPVIEEIGYLSDGFIQCGSWGITTPTQVKFTDEITKNGVKISLDSKSILSSMPRMIALRFGSYYALVNPIQFSNIILGPKIKVALLSNSGKLIAAYNNPDLNFIKSYLFNKNKVESKQDIISVNIEERFTAVATEHKSNFYATLSKQQLVLLPLSLLLALPIIAVIIYFSKRRLSIESELKNAINSGKLSIYYQPIIHLKSGYCIGAEALIRWFPSENESISPDYFIAVAEKAGLISKITKYVINTVITDMGITLAKNKSLHISINFDVHDFLTPDIISFLEEKLKNSGIGREQIWLEITERQVVEFETTGAVIDKIRSMGYQFAMDDFGTGYSNISYLKNLSLDILKIDKSFIDTLGMNTVTSGITDDIISMGKHLNLKIVAEGIETENQRDYLVKKDVDFGQGWLFAKALSCSDFLKYIHRNNMGSSCATHVSR